MSATDHHDGQADEPRDNVVPFPDRQVTSETPARPPGTELARVDRQAEKPPGTELAVDDSVDAEIVYEEKNEEPAEATGVGKLRDTFGTVVKSEKTVAVGKAAGRNLVYVATGAGVLAKRWWDRRTRFARYERAAELSRDQDAVRYWLEAGQKDKESRHRRRMEILALPWRLTKALFVIIPVGMVLLTLVGVAVAIHQGDLSLVFSPLLGTVETIGLVATVAMWLVGVLAFLSPALLVGVLWWVGRGANAAPAWLHSPRTKDAEATAAITADAVVRALQKLGNPKVTKAFKDGWIPPFELPPTREGTGQFKGYRTIFGLPEGVTPDMVIDANEVLAANLNRTGMESWPTDYGQEKGGRARHVNLYIADRGVMDRPTPTYPLMHEGSADVFEGVPIGITQRGDLVLMPMTGSNFVFGGRPGQGKSNGVRVVVAGCALDPLCEIRIHVFAGNGDFDEYERRLSRYQKGASKQHAAAAAAHLEELLAEVERREYRLAELGAKKLTRSISQQHKDMRPLLVGFSECHELFRDKDSGELAADLAVQVAKRGRKTGVMLGFDTQSSRANAIPSALVENMGVNCCFSVKTWRSNDGFLGDGSFAAGIRATALRFNVDRGTMMTTGMTDELFELIRTFYIEVDDDSGWDAATAIIERAMQQIDPDTRVDRPRLEAVEDPDRDLLEDVATLLKDTTDPVTTGALVGALKTLAPDWPPYQDLNVPALVKLLKDCNVDVKSTGNRYPVYPDAVRKARAR